MSAPDWHSDQGRKALDWLIDDLARVPYVPEPEIDAYVESTSVRLDGHTRNLPAHTKPLSPAETRVLQCAADGVEVGKIGARLGRSQETIRTQLRSARVKLRASSTGHACCIALREGMIQ